MNRRELLLSGLAMAGAAMVGNAQAIEHQHDMSIHEHHHADPANSALALSASDCIQKGQACLSHCLILLGDGDKEMAACAKSVNQMLAICGALQQLANQTRSCWLNKRPLRWKPAINVKKHVKTC